MIQARNLSLKVGDFQLRDICLTIEPDEYFVLLGPTGSGKTLFISCLCGLIRASGGSVRIDGRDVTDLEPRLRHIGYVPQDGGLFPHMSVAGNLTFSLRAQRVSHKRALKQIDPLIETLRLRPLLHRAPSGLSGGERQMVALGRALAIRPKLLLLDEPVSALDEPTRREVCAELLRVQKELRVATVHVCHNLDEALAIADRAGIMRKGRLVQAGTMDELMQKPRNETVARLLRATNIFRGKATPCADGRSLVSLVGGGQQIHIAGRYDGEIKFMIRPESLRVVPDGGDAVSAVLVRAELRGPYTSLEFDAGVKIVVHTQTHGAAERFEPGKRYAVEAPPESVYVFPAERDVETLDT